ncbi:MAG: hypothetical protein INF90_00445 [Roseomonas sp.]|jgi:hypothetical protein|nr:hypothetical protein [Roseomonas sp.]MCA3371269.1 hypothetical protein [Roseomonas sp.]
MIKKRLLLALPILAALAGGAAAQKSVTGSYNVEGRGPDGASYRGTVEVVPTGDTFRVTWLIDGQRYLGTGIGDESFISVSYRSGNDTGLALLVNENGVWSGIWTYAGGTKLGQERWTRR